MRPGRVFLCANGNVNEPLTSSPPSMPLRPSCSQYNTPGNVQGALQVSVGAAVRHVCCDANCGRPRLSVKAISPPTHVHGCMQGNSERTCRPSQTLTFPPSPQQTHHHHHHHKANLHQVPGGRHPQARSCCLQARSRRRQRLLSAARSPKLNLRHHPR